ncbi:MAG: hypothetical protein QGI29_04605 [Pirellulales bacterium]|nr:hypothetical protein [Pirellulales bacterium]
MCYYFHLVVCVAWPGLAWPGLPGLAWLAWPGLAPGLAWPLVWPGSRNPRIKQPSNQATLELNNPRLKALRF